MVGWVNQPRWPAELKADLKRFWDEGKSAVEIGRLLSRPDWLCTETAVRNQVHELGLKRTLDLANKLKRERRAEEEIARKGDAAWTPERIELLKKLNAEGKSNTEIMTALGHVTRNAVIGKLHRLGLTNSSQSRTKETQRLSRPRQRLATAGKNRPGFNLTIAPTPKPEPRRPAPPPEIILNPKAMDQLRRLDCRWMISDPDEPATAADLYCGAPVTFREGAPTSWCPRHYDRAHLPPERQPTAMRTKAMVPRDRANLHDPMGHWSASA